MKQIKAMVLLLAVISTLLLFSGCTQLTDPPPKAPDIECIGNWIDGSYRVVITVDTVDFGNREGTIVKSDNNNWNGGENGSGDSGYAVIRYTGATSDLEQGIINHYGILRWENKTATTITLEERYSRSGSFIDTVSEAETLLTEANSIFISSSDAEMEFIGSMGTWTKTADWGTSEITITNSEVDFGSYKAEIVEFRNNKWNDEEIGTGDFGYAVLKYTEAPSWNESLAGRFGILRWKDLTVSTFSYSEGYYDGGTYFETAAEAKATMTDENNAFSTFTEGADKESIENLGTWEFDGGTYISTLVVEEKNINFGLYSAVIVEMSNSSWNGSETGTGDYGYAVIYYNNPPSWNADLEGQYGILRWKDMTATHISYSEAYYDGGTYFETAAEAKETMTDENSAFALYTTGAEKQ